MEVGGSKDMIHSRRAVLVAAGAATAVSLLPAKVSLAAPRFMPSAGPRSRVLLVNDLSGDVDGLFAAVQMILSPSIELKGIIGTATGARGETAEASAELAREMLRLTQRPGVPVYVGEETKLMNVARPSQVSGVQAIIEEALRTDTNLPLFVAVGGGLTEVASALLTEPSIAGRLKLIWIGGSRSSAQTDIEYNFAIDRAAARYVYNDSTVPIWQVPREAYVSCTVSINEIAAFVAPCGAIGEFLYNKLVAATQKFSGYHMNTGETWTLGDNPLALLTALTDWVPSTLGARPRYERTGSSTYEEIATPILDNDGRPRPRDGGRKIRIYTSLDTRMMMNDLYAKLRVSAS
jgi:inosine-uridine nucleoside N-ribohydrolase